jgi:hypothetical protein
MKIYLAGPMSGYPQQNFPAFLIAAEQLRGLGFNVVSPAELDDEIDYNIAMADGVARKTWGDFLARDVKLIADGGIRGIVFLPHWNESRGARLEATIGLLQDNFSFWQYREPGAITSMGRSAVSLALHFAATGII